MSSFQLMSDEVEHHVKNLDTLAKSTLKLAIQDLEDDKATMSTFKETYQLGFNPVCLRKSGDLLLGFILMGDAMEAITVMVGGVEYDLTLQPNEFKYTLLTDILPVVALHYADVHLQLKDRTKNVYIECVWAALNTGYRGAIATSNWILTTKIEKECAVCTKGFFGFATEYSVKTTLKKDLKCGKFEVLKDVTWEMLHITWFVNKYFGKQPPTQKVEKKKKSFMDRLKKWF